MRTTPTDADGIDDLETAGPGSSPVSPITENPLFAGSSQEEANERAIPEGETRHHLVVAAYWTEDPAALATAKLAVSMKGQIVGSGAIVAVADENVDRELRSFLRRLQLEEAADWSPSCP